MARIVDYSDLWTLIKVRNLIQDDIGQQAFGSDGGAVIEGFAAEVVGVVAEDVALAGGGADFVFDAEQHRNILIGMQSVGDERTGPRSRWEWWPFGPTRR